MKANLLVKTSIFFTLIGSAGAQAAGITLFDDKGCKGASVDLAASIPDLAAIKFDNKTSSVKVADGKWVIFLEPNYQGKRFPAAADASLPVGACVNLEGDYDNQASSARKQ